MEEGAVEVVDYVIFRMIILGGRDAASPIQSHFCTVISLGALSSPPL